MKITTQVAAAVAALEDHEGRITPKAVLAEATDPASPLHPLFEWDDSVAANAHRLQQARELIRLVRIEVTTTTYPLFIPAYVPSASGERGGFRSITHVRSDDEDRRRAIVNEARMAENALDRALRIAEYLERPEDIAHLRRMANGVIARIRALAFEDA